MFHVKNRNGSLVPYPTREITRPKKVLLGIPVSSYFNDSQLAKMKKSIPDMSLP